MILFVGIFEDGKVDKCSVLGGKLDGGCFRYSSENSFIKLT